MAASPTDVNNLRLVFNGDILLLALFSCFVLLSLRRAFVRFSYSSEWLQGHILWSSKNQLVSVHAADHLAEQSTRDLKPKNLGTPHTRSKIARRDRRSPAASPSHPSTISSLLHSISSFFGRRITTGFSAGQVAILGVYGVILQYESFYKSNLFSDPIRTGFVGTAQIPFVFALAAKNNLLGSLVGMGYEKVSIDSCISRDLSDLNYTG